MAEAAAVVRLGPPDAKVSPEVHVVRTGGAGVRRVTIQYRLAGGELHTAAVLSASEAFAVQSALLAAARWAQGASNRPASLDLDPKAVPSMPTS